MFCWLESLNKKKYKYNKLILYNDCHEATMLVLLFHKNPLDGIDTFYAILNNKHTTREHRKISWHDS